MGENKKKQFGKISNPSANKGAKDWRPEETYWYHSSKHRQNVLLKHRTCLPFLLFYLNLC